VSTNTLQEAIAAVRTGNKAVGKQVLVQVLRADMGNELAWRWMAYAVEEIGRKRDCLEYILAIDPCEVGTYLLSYDYPALKNVTQSVRDDFASATTWKRYSHEIWDGANEPLAVILGTDYVLDIDVEAMSKETGGAAYTYDIVLPVPYKRRTEVWPELRSLCTLSLAARKVLVRAMQCVQIRSGFVEYRSESLFTDHLPSTPEFDEALTELAEAGLIDLQPSTAELLMNLTLKDLKRFAFDRGIKSSGPKHNLIQRLVAHVGQEEIETLLVETLDTEVRYIRPLVNDLPLLKKYIRAEVDRIELYSRWVEHVQCLHLAPLGDFVEPRPADHKMKSWSSQDRNPLQGWTSIEMQLVRKIWDAKCDEIVRDLADKHAWYAPWYVSDGIVAYLPSDKIEAFKRACDDHETRDWYNLLMYYGNVRLMQMQIKFREPRLLKCAGCQDEFLEWSIHKKCAERVGYKICFCNDCYSRVVWSYVKEAEPVTMSQGEMLNRLAELATVLGDVPSRAFVNNPDFAALSEEKQIAVVRALLSIPSYKTYVETFGSWLNALVLAGVLEDGTYRTSRGVRCVATDGHECFSLAEKAIDDWLSAHHIPHEKEPVYPYDSQLNPTRMRADWKVREVFIEYAGLMSEPDYSAKMETKQKLSAKFGIPLIVITPEDMQNLDEKLRLLINS
jgi:hypothetical protein